MTEYDQSLSLFCLSVKPNRGCLGSKGSVLCGNKIVEIALMNAYRATKPCHSQQALSDQAADLSCGEAQKFCDLSNSKKG